MGREWQASVAELILGMGLYPRSATMPRVLSRAPVFLRSVLGGSFCLIRAPSDTYTLFLPTETLSLGQGPLSQLCAPGELNPVATL